MDGIINLGPLAFATDRLLAVGLLIAFFIAMDRILAHAGAGAVPATGFSILVGIVVARAAYVFQHINAFAQDWSAAFAIWQGGFDPWPGFIAAAAVLAWRMRPLPEMAKGIATLATFAAAWFIGAALLEPEPRQLPELPSLAHLNGMPFETEALAGQPFVVNLWATWCPPCRRELPMLAEVAEASDTPILLVNQGEEPEAVRNYLLANRVSPSAVVLDRSSALLSALGNAALPTTLFVDNSGQVVATHVGEISRAALAEQMSELEGE